MRITSTPWCVGALVPVLFAIASSAAAANPCQGLLGQEWILDDPEVPSEAPSIFVDRAQYSAASDPYPATCHVVGRIETEAVTGIPATPITFVQWLPHAEGMGECTPGVNCYNGKLHHAGTGGFGGWSLGDLNWASQRETRWGYTTVATDGGHLGLPPAEYRLWDGSWALDCTTDPCVAKTEEQINNAHRATHLVTVATKQIAAYHYGAPPERAYFTGCSAGGRQGLMEAQRFPDDFDGVIAGDPPVDLDGILISWIWNQQAQFPVPGDRFLPAVHPSKVSLLGSLVMEACDGVDGLVDGIIDDPRTCGFDPVEDLPRCTDGPDCFTDAEIEVIDRIYRGPVIDLGEGPEQVAPGVTLGGEDVPGLGWDRFITGVDDSGDEHTDRQFFPRAEQPGFPTAEYAVATENVRFFLLNDPSADLHDFVLDAEGVETVRGDGLSNADDPDLGPFRDRGGKLILYHGWADPANGPLDTVAYYEEVDQTVPGGARDFARLFMKPGVLHCGGGPGPDDARATMLRALEDWVERGVAPESIIAVNNTSGLSRPLCPYPQVARPIDPNGSISDPSNFHCVEPAD